MLIKSLFIFLNYGCTVIGIYFLDERIITKKRPIGPGSDVVTKHDAIVCGRRNTKNVENVGCSVFHFCLFIIICMLKAFLSLTRQKVEE